MSSDMNKEHPMVSVTNSDVFNGVISALNVAVKLKELRNPEIVEGAAVALPMDVVDAISSRFANTLFEGMESVMENGPWLIRYVPLDSNVWTPNTDLKKDVIKTAPLWVKLQSLPLLLIEEELKDSLVIAIPRSNGKGHSLATIEVEYEWTPPRCSTCKNKQIEGIRLSKPALNLQYRKVDKGETSKKNDSNKTVPNKGKVQTDNATNAPIISTKNSFGALSENEDLEFNSTRVVNEDSDDEAVDEVLIFDDRQGQSFVTKGASTPVTTLVHLVCIIAMREFKNVWLILKVLGCSKIAGAHAIFKPYRNSDHSPSILCIPTAGNDKPKPFKFFNVLTKHERFRDIVNETWNIDVALNMIHGGRNFEIKRLSFPMGDDTSRGLMGILLLRFSKNAGRGPVAVKYLGVTPFILPSSRLMVDGLPRSLWKSFLWCPVILESKAKIAWDVVCHPKDEGGLW
ncbi:zinc knuckle CX2CX4HX4C containing protein [Tanacetum coccineum]